MNPITISFYTFNFFIFPTPYKFDVIDYKNLTHVGMKNSIDTDGILFFERTK